MRLPTRKLGKYMVQPTDPCITIEKLEELKTKLARLKKARPKLAMEVSHLAELGDFSENVEYQLAKGKLRGLNNNILKIEKQINGAVIIDPSKKKDVVLLGHRVTVEINGSEKTYQILGSTESNPSKGIISQNSPIGSALLGKKVGDEVEVEVGEKKVKYKILDIK